jgi:hypothetical protein
LFPTTATTSSLDSAESRLTFLRARSGDGGGHGHTVNSGNGVGGGDHVSAHSIAPNEGLHGHPVTDPGHRHNGVDSTLGSAFIYTAWGGRNKLDGPFNDSSHTYSVEPAEFTKSAATGVTISNTTGGHSHRITGAGEHTHSVVVDAVGTHSHSLPADTVVGGTTPVDFSPLHMAVYFYVKAG